jgi:UPF0755 protein
MELESVFSNPQTPLASMSKKRKYLIMIGSFLTAGFLLMAIFFLIMTSAPRKQNSDEGLIIRIPQGTSVRKTAILLKEEKIIRSKKLFELALSVSDKEVIAGDYLFDEPLSLERVISRVSKGVFGDVYVRIRIPEGATRQQIVDILEPQLENFDGVLFMSLTKDKEGYLFPDTHFFFPGSTTEEVVLQLEKIFNERMTSIEDVITTSPYTLDEIITMASLIQKEATGDFEEQQIISGILWKRIRIRMALQVDATFVYSIGKGSAELSIADLEKDGPYNTYTNLGLPPTPIGSPGLSAIKAAAQPKESPYLFYLHGNDGIVRYARNFDEHIQNKRNYLK